MSAALALEMPLYDPNEKRENMVAITFRVPRELIEDMDAVVRLHKTYAIARGDDPTRIDRSSVMRKILRSGKDQAFAEFGGAPESEADWAKLEAAVLKVVKSAKR